MRNSRQFLSLVILTVSSFSYVYAAQPFILEKQPVNSLMAIITPSSDPGLRSNINNTIDTKNFLEMKINKKAVDLKKKLHVRVSQTYLGYLVWGGGGIIHIPNGSEKINSIASLKATINNKTKMNGVFYKNIGNDLKQAPRVVFTQNQSDIALQTVAQKYNQSSKDKIKLERNNHKVELIVYLDKGNKAHWAFHVELYSALALPNSIVDAQTFEVYEQWDNIRYANPANLFVPVKMSGEGGNGSSGKIVYGEVYPLLDVMRDPVTQICYRINADVIVFSSRDLHSFNSPDDRNYYITGKPSNFNCVNLDSKMAAYLDAPQADAFNEAYSPTNDALYNGKIIVKMFNDWYQLRITTRKMTDSYLEESAVSITNTGNTLAFLVQNDSIGNADYNSKFGIITIHGGDQETYPFTSIDVLAHEAGHAFTFMNAELLYRGQSGAMDESFSDMTSQAVKFYQNIPMNWQLGEGLFKSDNKPLRYMDKPSKDCVPGNVPGYKCSIDNINQAVVVPDSTPEEYQAAYVHFASGIYNRVFYLMATAPGWDVRKAYNVMVHANQYYWYDPNFTTGACDVLSATTDLEYETKAVVNAFNDVGIDTSQC